MTVADTTYNGWTNYETWLVNLWMDEEQGWFREMASDAFGTASADAFLTKDEMARITLADWLKEHWEENRPELPGLYGDLLGAALSAVNWDEIARHYIDVVLEEVK